MARTKRLLVSSAVVMAATFVMSPMASIAKPTPIDPGKVQALATQVEAALTGLGCNATLKDDVAAIQAAIAGSGADPAVAEAALRVVQSAPDLCASARPAVASVEQTIEEAEAGNIVPAAGGPGGGSPIGAPAAYVSGGGSDYLTR
jgi:hypothetical protein